MATNPYSSQSAPATYNQNPPPDDGTEVAANEIEWAKHINKIGDPLKTFAESINSAVLSAFGKTFNTDADENNALAGSLAFTDSELTIASGAITPTRSHHRVDTEADGATDDLETINTTSVSDGAILILRAENAGRTVVVKDGTGNINLQSNRDFTIDDLEKKLVLQRRGTDWDEVSRNKLDEVILKRETVASTSSGTSVSFSSIPTGTTRITVVLDQVSLSGTDEIELQIGDAGGLEATGYTGGVDVPGTASATNSTSFNLVANSAATKTWTGVFILYNITGNVWVINGHAGNTAAVANNSGLAFGTKTLSAELTQLEITPTGTDSFDNGQINIIIE